MLSLGPRVSFFVLRAPLSLMMGDVDVSLFGVEEWPPLFFAV